jgi:hypothetical protein
VVAVIDTIKEKIRMAKKVVEDEGEPYKLEAFKIVLSNMLNQRGYITTQSEKEETKRGADDSKTFSFSGPSKNIYDLMQDDFFNQPKLLSEVKSELEKNGCFYDIRRIDQSLRKVFVKNNKLLTRIKSGSRWAYVIKR